MTETDNQVGECTGCGAPLIEQEDGAWELEGCECERGWDQ